MSRIDACRVSGSRDLRVFLDLGETPLADALVFPEQANDPEARYPLELAFCPESKLVQITHDVSPQELFVDNYLYFSSFSDHLLDHARHHAEGLIETRDLDERSLVVEIASNDGYLLKEFVNRGVPVVGVDPAPHQARAAIDAGVPTLAEFFTADLGRQLRSNGPADLIIANNVMAHVPDPNDVVAGMKELLAPGGLITIENPCVRDLIANCEFDTIYHEHFFYHSCHSIDYLVSRHGLFLNDAEEFPDLHGGTLRWHISHQEGSTERLEALMREEVEIGLTDSAAYADFGERVRRLRSNLLDLLQELRSGGNTIAAYGAAAKGSTLLNTVGIGSDLVDFVVDRNTHKQGLLMPGTHQPIADPEALLDEQPDFVLVLAWNFFDEIRRQQAEYERRGGRFIIPVPEPRIVP